MARVSHLQASFTSGELSPRLYGRVDLAKYQTGLAKCRNMVLMPHGGVNRRSGTRFVHEVKDSSKAVRLIPFEFSTVQAYVLEFGDQYMRVYKDGGIVVSSGVPYEIVTPYLEADIQKLSFAQNADTLFLVHPKYAPRSLTRTGHDAWSLTTLGFTDGPYLDENTDQAKTITPGGKGQYVTNGTFDNDIASWTDKSSGTGAKILWDNTSMMDLIGVASGTAYGEQTVTLTASGVEHTLEFEVKSGPVTMRLGTTTGGQEILTDVAYEKGVQTVKLTPAATTVYLGFLHTANASRAVDNVSISRQESITLTANFDIFQAGHVGAFFRLKQGAYTGYVKITAVTDLRHATATVMDPLASLAATYEWREGAWSDHQGWPGSVVFHQQRLVFAGTAMSPQTVWASRTQRFTDFTIGTEADDPLNITVASNQVNAINWMVSSKSLVLGTIGSEWRMGSADGSDMILQPANAAAIQETTHGSFPALLPVRAAGQTIFVQRSGRKVRELAYDFNTNGWVAPDLSLLAEHITVGGIKDIAYAQEPDSIIWMVRGDGVLLGLTYNRAEQVVGWHWHDTDGQFERVCTIHSGEEDQVWFVVKRTIGGVTKRYVEYMTAPFVDQDVKDAVFVDCSLPYSGAPATTLSGLGHLEGKTAHILADGSVRTPRVVTGGAVGLDNAAAKAVVGLPFVSEIQTLKPEAGADDGTAQGHIKRVNKVTVRVHRSLGYEVGSSQSNMFRPPHRDTTDKMGVATPLFSGDDKVAIEGRYDFDGQIWIRQTQPLPLTVLAVICQMGTNG
jgi:hypothetical protein